MSKISVLFARADSVYKTMGLDVWDIERNALLWTGGNAGIFHPPCRAWGKLAHLAKPRQGERELAFWAVDQVRTYGGVLEHPASSKLWKEKPLPPVGKRDAWGGFTIKVSQFLWGHKAEKSTFLYICGCEPENVPAIPDRVGNPTHMVSGDVRKSGKPGLSQANRERTPPKFAEWLVSLAGIINSKKEGA